MTKSRYLHAALLLAALVAGGSASFAASSGELLQQGLYAEEVEGNPDAAFKIYEQIARSDSAPPNHVAQALYRMAMCCVKTNDEATARKLATKLVADYPSQKEVVEKAQALLENLPDFDPASLMPPGTIAYVEFGSPGHQVETVLAMLKGTPYENPLAAVAGAQPQSTNTVHKSPADILRALLNPSMVAEFKKVRSSAVGVTGVDLQNPPMIAVLYPGKSDALRGLVQAGLALEGTPGAPIEGMQTFNILLPDKKAIAVAYDDRIFIATQPADQLRWCVRQYKGLTSEPSLASARSFAKVEKSQRQKNALTVWINVDEAYGRLIGASPGNVLPGLLSANAMMDFTNIDSLTMTFSIEPDGAGTKTELQFKDGHHCLAFDLIRTPNISPAALEAVPSQAIALASFSLSESASPRSDLVRAQLQNITGLDVGREVFANIEQVVLFVMPSEGNSRTATNDSLAGQIGLAFTSRNPEQTRQVFTTLLSTANLASAPHQKAGVSQFKIGKTGDRDLYCFLDQVNGTTLLALNRTVLDASMSSIRNHKSVLTSGPLKGAVNQLPASTSKLALVNAGGAVRWIGPRMKPGTLNDEQADRFYASLDQLAQALDQTVVELRTDERTDSLIVDSCLTGLPPMGNQVIGPVSQIARVLEEARAEVTAANLRRQTPALIMPVAKAPAIDGNEDEAWSRAPRYKLANVLKSFGSGEGPSPISSPADLSAEFRALWDGNRLYLLVDVTDDKLIHDTDPDKAITVPSGSRTIPWWYDDSIEVYLDADNAKATAYGNHDAQFRFNWGEKPVLRVYRQNVEVQLPDVEWAMVKTDKGYRLEASFGWNAFAMKPSVGAIIGLDVHVNDDDDGGQRDNKITWHDTTDNAWQSPQSFGNGLLGGLVGWWRFDETEGTIARDSSGGNHNGVFVGRPTWSKGKRGGAVKLDGHDSFIRVGKGSAFDMANQVTTACWVNIHSVPAPWMAIITKGDNAWRLSTSEQERRLHFSVNNWDRVSVNSSTTINADRWYHVAAVHDGSAVKLYVDGKLNAQQPWTNGIGRNNFEVLIGENAEHKGRCFDGLIDDARIYNYALSDDEVKSLAADP